jgi:hypothetical protein
LWLIKTTELIDKYPQEAFSALQSYPDDYLKRWDQLCLIAPHTGVAANDAHQNIGVRVELGQDDKVIVSDALGEELLKLDRLLVAPLLKIPQGAKPGDLLLKLQLDPYQNSLRHAGTHVLVNELSQEGVWEGLEEGRTWVAFDWLADSKGFDVALIESPENQSSTRHEIGSRLEWEKLQGIESGEGNQGPRLVGQSPLLAHWKVYRSTSESTGELVYQTSGERLDWAIPTAGNYRIELWLELLGQPHCWILSSPFYLKP